MLVLSLFLALVAAAPASNPESDSSAQFPINVGYQGSYSMGRLPFLAQENGAPITGESSYVLPQPIDIGDDNTDDGTQESVFNMMASYSKYHSPNQAWGNVAEYGVPPQCRIKQVHSLSRHGSRYDSQVSDLQEWFDENKGFTASGDLEFLNDYKLDTGMAALVAFGKQQLFDKGIKTFLRYGQLMNQTDHKLVARTTSIERMTESAKYFLAGAFGLDWEEKVNLEVQIESEGFNTTLAPEEACAPVEVDNASDISKSYRNKYLSKTQKRLKQFISNGKLTNIALTAMQKLCAFETNSIGYSKFCNLFTREDWEGWQTRRSYDYYYANSFGNPNSRARGIGYVDDLRHRLLNKPFELSELTSQNKTLTMDPEYFPVDQPIYLDFTHDDVIINILTALGIDLFKTEYTISKDGTISQSNDSWNISDIVPFAAHLMFEVIECDQPVPGDRESSSADGGSTKYIHAILNDRTLPLDKQSIAECEERIDGWCEFDSFIEHLKNSSEKAQFETACSGKIATTQVTDGAPEN